MKAILRTWFSDMFHVDDIVEIHDDHEFFNGPYVDTVPFSVGKNQEILPLND